MWQSTQHCHVDYFDDVDATWINLIYLLILLLKNLILS